jgi:3-methyl-2-oxobutanoate hydroxymethyltransferase
MVIADSPRGLDVKKDRAYLQARKKRHEPIVMLTAYDYPTAVAEEQAGIDVVLVGDSVGTNMLGYASEAEVTMDDIVHHTRAVRRGLRDAYLLADMPYRSFDSPPIALRNARILLQAGADGVKLEGGVDQVEIVRTLVGEGIEVCGHIGFTPQTLGSKGRIQGKTLEQAKVLVESALALQDAGAFMLVLELVTEDISRLISERLTIPTIGIGAGRFCDGQVLVVNDVLGISPVTFKLARRYQEYRNLTLRAIEAYRQDVASRSFPAEENVFPTKPEELRLVEGWLRAGDSGSGNEDTR